MQTFLVLGLRKDMSGTAVQKAGRLSKKNGVISKWHKSQHKGSSLAIDGTMWVSKASRALHESTQLILTSTLWVISRLETEKLRHRKRLKVSWPRDPQLPSPSAASTEAAPRLWSSETREARDSPGGLLVKNLPANAGGMDLIPGPGRPHVPQSSWARAPRLLCLPAPRVPAPQEKPLQWEARALHLESRPHELQPEEVHIQRKRPSAATNINK